MSERIIAAVGIIAITACASSPTKPIPMAVLIDGDRAAAGSITPAAVEGLELHEIALPNPAPPAGDDRSATIASARTAFANGDFSVCRSKLDALDTMHLLADGDRMLAARALALQTACTWPNKSDAQSIAARFAGFGLELPDMTLPPEIDKLLQDEIKKAGGSPRHALAIQGVVGASLSIDGRPADCTLPCTVGLAAGAHVLAVTADGYAPAATIVRTPDSSSTTLNQEAATTTLAAKQWRARMGRGQPATDAVGVQLLAKLGGNRVAYLHADREVAAALVVDGTLVASVTRGRGQGDTAIRELAYDGHVLHRPSVLQRPWFWIATAAAAIVVAGGIVALTYQPETKSVPTF